MERLLTQRRRLVAALMRPVNERKLRQLDELASELEHRRGLALAAAGTPSFEEALAATVPLNATPVAFDRSDTSRAWELLQVAGALVRAGRRERLTLNEMKLIVVGVFGSVGTLGSKVGLTLRDYPTSWAATLRILRDHGVALHNPREALRLRLPPGDLELLQSLNHLRRGLGLPALRLDSALYSAAVAHCEAMIRLGFFSHESPLPGQRTPLARARHFGFEGLRVDEEIARTGTARETFAAWREGTALDPTWGRVGAAARSDGRRATGLFAPDPKGLQGLGAGLAPARPPERSSAKPPPSASVEPWDQYLRGEAAGGTRTNRR